MAATDHIHAEGRRLGRKEGKIAGLRIAVANLTTWATTARGLDDDAEAVSLEEAAESLRQIANRMEEEG